MPSSTPLGLCCLFLRFWEVRAGEGKKVAKSQDCVCIPYISHPLVPARRNPPFSKQVRSPGQFSFLGSHKLTVRIRVLLNYSRINNNHASGNCWPFAISFFSNTVLRMFYFSFKEQQRRHKRVKQLTQCDRVWSQRASFISVRSG